MASSSLMENLSHEFAAAAEQAGRSVVAVQAQHRTTSSGIQWRTGVVVTADHSIRRADDIHVVLEPGKSIPATVSGRDPSTDLAVLKPQDQVGLVQPEFADARTLKLGHLVLALGRSARGHLVASAGIVGGLSDEWRSWRGGKLDQHVRLDLTLYPGFSGGPLVTAQGKVVGINTSGLSRGRAMTIPISTVNRVVDELLEKGHIARPYLGLAMQPVGIPEALRDKLKSRPGTGLLVIHVEPSSPADQGGLLLGDVLTEIQGKPMEGMDNIQELLASAKIGETLAMGAIRGGTVMQISIKLGERPPR